MHKSALDKVAAFVEGYLGPYKNTSLDVLDVGSQVVDEQPYSHNSIFSNKNWNYAGMDIEDGTNVDITVSKHYEWEEIQSQSYDVIVCSQVFEHVEWPWATMMEITRVLKCGGIAMIVAPSQGKEHKYPYDCWRYYSDGFVALTKYVQCNVLEVRTQWRDIYSKSGQWHDSAIVIQKPNWNEEELRSFMLRNQHGKLALYDHNQTDASVGLEDIAPIQSVIEPLKCLDVFKKLEERIIRERGVVRIKTKRIAAHAREMLRVLKKPI